MWTGVPEARLPVQRVRATSLHLVGGRPAGWGLTLPRLLGPEQKVGTQDRGSFPVRPAPTLSSCVPFQGSPNPWQPYGPLTQASHQHGPTLPFEALEVIGVGGRSRPRHWRLQGLCLSFPTCELGIRATPPSWVFENEVTWCVGSSRCGRPCAWAP